eukprot:Nitzschia sp. Nitz4//scaffold257_size48314//38237//39084//NITZ4_007095-RA/size48314-snap-gene-0.27-mRNA-1//-1//CDS//3329544466//7549//frame0
MRSGILASLLTTLLSSAVMAEDSVASSSAPSSAPTPGPNACDELAIGDLYFVSISSLNPNYVSIFNFEDIPGGLDLYLTDNAWTGTYFQTNEGTLQFTTPSEGIPQFTTFGYGGDKYLTELWEPIEGAFALEEDGDQVFLYCFGSMGDVVPLAAISYAGPFADAGLSSYDTNESALPDSLGANASIALDLCGAWEYNGVSNVQVDVLRAAVQETDNWKSQGGCSAATGLSSSSFFVASLALVWGIVGTLGML